MFSSRKAFVGEPEEQGRLGSSTGRDDDARSAQQLAESLPKQRLPGREPPSKKPVVTDDSMTSSTKIAEALEQSQDARGRLRQPWSNLPDEVKLFAVPLLCKLTEAHVELGVNEDSGPVAPTNLCRSRSVESLSRSRHRSYHSWRGGLSPVQGRPSVIVVLAAIKRSESRKR